MQPRLYKILVFSGLWMVFALNGCGSGGDKTQAVTARISEPAEVSALSKDERVVALSFIDTEDGEVLSEGHLSPSEDGITWTGTIPALKEGTYLLQLELQQTWDPASLQVALADADSTMIEVPVALYQATLLIDGGQNQILFDVAPGDFSLGIDDDGDGLSNLREVSGTTHPLLADTDGDGVFDGLDFFPDLAAEFGDGDADGVGDNADNCFSLTNPGQEDNDGDGDGNACDSDDDNDGLGDANEAAAGTDPLDADSDDDGVGDGTDNCGATANADQVDTDGDGVGNACDTDDDNDGLADVSDKCPLLASADQTDSNGDGVGDVCTGDDDGDGVPDASEGVDSLGRASDNCRTVANPDQTNTDGDAQGDACDPDDDNDGLSDAEEDSPGADNLLTNRLSADTDGDGIGDGVDNCRITPNPSQASTGDIDGEGDACDCFATNEIVTHEAVFVRTGGNDASSGARNDPVQTIAKGIQLAQAQGKSKVFVAAGTYNGAVSMADGVSVYGGFSLSADGSTCQKQLASGGADVNLTKITASSGPTIVFSNLANATKLEGISVESLSAESDLTLVSISLNAASSVNNVSLVNVYLTAPNNALGSTRALSVTNASPVVVNSVLNGGDSQESTAVSLLGSPAAKFAHNTIRGGAASSTSTALHALGSAPALVDNILFTAAGNTQRVLFFADPSPSPAIICRNNLIFGLQGTSPDVPKLYMDLSPALNVHTTIGGVNGLGGNFSGNVGTALGLAGIFTNANLNDYRLTAASPALSIGLDPIAIGVTVSDDHDGGVRPQGAGRDAGAFER